MRASVCVFLPLAAPTGQNFRACGTPFAGQRQPNRLPKALLSTPLPFRVETGKIPSQRLGRSHVQIEASPALSAEALD